MSSVVIILGMHRSGTSSLAGSLQQKGLFLGKVSTKDAHNKKGSRENFEIARLNETLLERNGGHWYKPPNRIRWDKGLINQRDRIIESAGNGSRGPWGFKDPRTIVTLPFWLEALDSFQLVGIFRHPLLVAKSLHARTPEMAIEYALRLWGRYNYQMMAYFQKREFPLLCFDVSSEEFMAAIDATAKYLRLPGPKNNGTDKFYDASLKNQIGLSNGDRLPKDLSSLYAAMKRVHEKQFAR